jgi:hypothetical protein
LAILVDFGRNQQRFAPLAVPIVADYLQLESGKQQSDFRP